MDDNCAPDDLRASDDLGVRCDGRARFHPLIAAVAVAWIGLAGSVTSVAAQAATVEVTIENVKSTDGSLLIAVYDNADDYRKKAVKELKIPAVTPAATLSLADLAPGDCAITLFHDRNGNGKIDSNLFGIPTEPYGFSGNPKNLMSPATWEQSRFSVTNNGARLPIRLSD